MMEEAGLKGRKGWRRGQSRLVSRVLPIYVALLFAILSFVGVMLVVRLKHVLLIIFISMLFAAALSGPVEWAAEHLHLPRALSALRPTPLSRCSPVHSRSHIQERRLR